MNKLKYTIFLILLTFMISGCSMNSAEKNTNFISTVSEVVEASPIDDVDKAEVNDPVAEMYGLGAVEESQESALLGDFSTKFNAKSKGRANNITVASKSIHGKVIMPGETFSYNETLGPTNTANGYKVAKIFIKGKEANGVGGGVCQVSSTLYNAVERAGLEVVERHNHSKKVGYVPEGKDAATSYGGVDFKFLNNQENPVKINSYVKDGKVAVEIYKI